MKDKKLIWIIQKWLADCGLRDKVWDEAPDMLAEVITKAGYILKEKKK